ncbi:hypothetical protein G7046_g4897 [Stylonectria norvegica]|nr:hypothetical protein G7046_g4897 [Stylonectria norvegica]
MRWDACKHLEGATERVRFDKLGPVIRMNESDPPVFSIFKSQGTETPSPVPIGMPVLSSSPGTPALFHLIKSWLQDCDQHHDACKLTPTQQEAPRITAVSDNKDDLEATMFRGIQSRRASTLPTRLIRLNGTGARLYETKPADKTEEFRYIALSHPWGDATEQKPHFCTTVANKAEHLKSIDFGKLPDTFKDAIITARGLGVAYLWIDSICIVQGPDGDFDSESKRMENVFSSAHCVIAASRATGQWDGFLKDRAKSAHNEYVVLQDSSKRSIYVSRFVDDFNKHVLEGTLTQRGWVLQERALARRTVYFTDQQIYWECGDGVRCETFTKMKNQLAAFLGDPNFPEVAIRSFDSQQQTSRGQRILYFQDLYKTYARLNFTHWEDRAVALNGLEQRLIRGFNCRGGFGILDDSTRWGPSHRSLLHRSLLWHRAVDGDSLREIPFPPHRQKVPTWSWMAFKGAIDYLSVPFDAVDWEEDDLKSPWKANETRSDGYIETQDIITIGRQLVAKPDSRQDVELFLNTPRQSQPIFSNYLCVVVESQNGAVDDGLLGKDVSRLFSLSSSPSLDPFAALCSQTATLEQYPLASSIKQNIPIYNLAPFDTLTDEQRSALQDEWYRVLLRGPGVFVTAGLFRDKDLLDSVTKTFGNIIEKEKQTATTHGDHFAAPGRMIYYSNPYLGLISRAWLGPGYRITAQVNNVKPGAAPQVSHRDYHLGFMSAEACAQIPRAMQVASQCLTLQGAVAHVDVPLESGPTRLLPFSQAFTEGYMSYRLPEFIDFFLENYVALPLEKGDGLFFNPALFHAAGENKSADINRLANLLQISSAFGKPMEAINALPIVESCWDDAVRLYKEKGLSDEVKSLIAAIGEGYAFPTNLDRNPPRADNMAPESEQDVILNGLLTGQSKDQVVGAMEEYRLRSEA